MPSNNFQQVIFQELEKYFGPLVDASSDDVDTLLRFFKGAINWDIQTVSSNNTGSFVTSIANIAGQTALIESVYDNPPQTFSDFLNAVNSISTLISAIQSVNTSLSGANVPSFIEELIEDIFSKLTVIYLYNERPIFFGVLLALNIVEYDAPSYQADGAGKPVVKDMAVGFNLYFDRIGSFLKDPISYLKNTFMPGGIPDQDTANAVGRNIFSHIGYLLDTLYVGYTMGRGDGPNEFTAAQEAQLDGMITLNKLFYIDDTTGTINAGATMGLIPASSGGPGVFIVPFGNLNFTVDISNWTLAVSIDSTAPGFKIDQSGIQFYDTSGDTSVLLQLTASRVEASGNTFLIGSATGTHLTIGEVTVAGVLDVINSNCNADISLAIQNSSFTLSAGDGDNFLQNILPSDGLNFNFDLTIGYNNQKGLYFKGGAGLEVQIPVHINAFGLNVDNILLSVTVADDGTIPISASTSFSLDVGPLTVSVQSVGVQASLSFPSGGGNLGPLGFSLDFKPPTGLGISISAGQVSGGGFLNFDASTSTYTGALQLKFSSISLNAIGILTTKMPDGSDGYSLLIIITAQFTPIQLGMGFTLNGVGGLLGLNRTMNTDRLRSGVQDGSLDYILFPQNVVENANAIISNISQAFPVYQGQFLIGPMAKLGWGTPTLLTIELGVIIQLPSASTIAILGIIKALLPSDTNRILAIQVNFLGILDFSKDYLSFDALLYDSKILTFGLTGSMSLRLYWGDNPSFLLSVGGFNPKYTPPPIMDLPPMQRLGIVLASDNNLQITVQTYFAITSNTAQFGASVSLVAKVSKLQLIGNVGFDVLFQFSPFYFTADLHASLQVKWKNDNLFTITADITLEGPHPWRVQGSAGVKVLGHRFSVPFNKTFGQANVAAISAVQVMPQLQAAIQDQDNWQVTGPDRSHQVVTFKTIVVVSGQLIVDPFGALQFSQKVVPIDITISKFNTSAISDDNYFDIGVVSSGGTALPTSKIQDYFAPNSFFYLTDDQKLSRASYEEYNSGVSIGNTATVIADYCVNKAIAYEDIILDLRQRAIWNVALPLSTTEYQMHLTSNYISNASVSATNGRTPADGVPRVNVTRSAGFALADMNTLGQIGTGTYLNYDAAHAQLVSLLGSDPVNAANYMIVNTYEL